MSWQLIIILQIIISTGVALFARRVTLADPKYFYTIGALSYAGVATMGVIYSLIFLDHPPKIDDPTAWWFIALEGLAIPAAWLIQYRLISRIGAANAIIATTANTIAAALAGILFLQDTFSGFFLLGAGLVTAASLMVLRIKPSIKQRQTLPLSAGAKLIVLGSILFAFGMYGEKMAIDIAGVWNYAVYGWAAQAVGALIICLIFGRKELSALPLRVVSKGLLLGVLTSLAGALYVYALSIGQLSHTAIASSGKVALTVALAAIFLRERNSIGVRIVASTLAIIGVWLVLL